MDDRKHAFVIGHPIKHSRSPLIHHKWLKGHGIHGHYDRIDVVPNDLAAFIGQIRNGQWVGGNVTIPHKQAVMAHVDHVSEDARRIGAANTLWMNDGKLLATNTDAYGFAANMDDFAPAWRTAKSSLIIGAGGASRAIVQACVSAGHQNVTVVNRTEQKAEQLAADFKIQTAPYAPTLADVSAYDVLINTTSAGMGTIPPLPINFASARRGAIAVDIVYAPLNTPFLNAARDHGLATVDGIGMLIHQAVPGFELWFGIRPHVDTELRQMLLRDLGEIA